MTEIDVLELCREALFIILKITTPLLAVVLVTGLIIAIIQALTQIQESTLSFAPKIIAVMLAVIFFSSYIGKKMQCFSELIWEKIEMIE